MGLGTDIVQDTSGQDVTKSILVENTTFRKGLNKGKLGYIRMVTLCPQDEL